MTSGRGAAANGFSIPVTIAVTCLVILALPDQGRGLFAYDRALVAAGEWWRILTAHLAHLSVPHGLMNLAALAMIAWLFRGDFGVLAWSTGFAVPALVIGVGLFAAWPDVGWYVGLSGILHGLVAAGGLTWCLGGERVAGGVLLAILAAKLLYESVFGPVPGSEAAAGGRVLVESHLLGAVGGLLGVAVTALAGRGGEPGRRL